MERERRIDQDTSRRFLAYVAENGLLMHRPTLSSWKIQRPQSSIQQPTWQVRGYCAQDPSEFMEVPSRALHRMRKLTLFPTVNKGPSQVSNNEATGIRAGRLVGVS
jgi:hypothetical protein